MVTRVGDEEIAREVVSEALRMAKAGVGARAVFGSDASAACERGSTIDWGRLGDRDVDES
jgi:hypothetical protein